MTKNQKGLFPLSPPPRGEGAGGWGTSDFERAAKVLRKFKFLNRSEVVEFRVQMRERSGRSRLKRSKGKVSAGVDQTR
jgi:hypothetical protein